MTQQQLQIYVNFCSQCPQSAGLSLQQTDFGTITLLFQDSVGGLEVEDQTSKGTCLPIESAGSGEMILNAGDCLQQWTVDRICSARHRVHAPTTTGTSTNGTNGVDPEAQNNSVPERFSIVYFAKPDRDGVLRLLKNEWVSVGEKHGTDGHVLTAGEFQLSRINGTY